MKKTLVVYHSADFDGIFCREIARKFLGEEAEYVGWTHGDPLIEMPEDGTVYILDLSPQCLSPNKKGEPFYDQHDRIIWIDHHNSAIEEFNDKIPGYRIDGVAACRLAWFYYTALERYKAQSTTGDLTWFQEHYPWASKQDFIDRKLAEPLAVRLAGEYDIWDKRDPNAELFQHGLRSKELTHIDWEMLLSCDIPETLAGTGLEQTHSELMVPSFLEKGRAIQYANNQENSDIITNYGFDVQFEGLKFLACNHARFNSYLFKAAIRADHDALLGFKWDGKQWSISLYGIDYIPVIDLSLIALKFGGGGHKGACGFRMTTAQMLEAGIIK